MRTIRLLYRVVRFFFIVYGAWNAVMKSRLVTITLALFRLLYRQRRKNVQRAAAITFIDGSEPAIYRREGWRRIKLYRDPPETRDP